MNSPLWNEAIAKCADPDRARHYLKLLAGSPLGGLLEQFTRDLVEPLVAVFSGSQTRSDWLVANPGLAASLRLEQLRHPRYAAGLRREVAQFLEPALAAREFGPALARLRQFKQREMLRIAARDLCRLGDAVGITQEISDVADTTLDAVWRVCRRQFTDRFGRPYHPDLAGNWVETAVCVLGLGKLGGQELNYSSDVDLLFVYADEGVVFREPPQSKRTMQRVMSNHQFFNRLAESFIAEVTRLTPEGSLFRIDLRLRPEGDAGPVSRSLESYENYYAQWGQTWERMMLIKSRCVAGDVTMGHEFLDMIQPFRYPRLIQENVLGEIAAMKARIESEVVKAGELERNVKLGRGGIREIEFLAQSLQLLHAGRLPFLQISQTLPCLDKLAQYRLVANGDAQALTQAYVFLRDVEHRLQMEADQQTHTIPTDTAARERLARLMGFADITAFESALAGHSRKVREAYERFLKLERPGAPTPYPREFDAAAPVWKDLLAKHRFREPEAVYRVLKEFAEGPGYVHVSAHTTLLAHQLIPRILGLCPRLDAVAASPARDESARWLSDPDRVLTRLDSFIAAYGARAALFELWTRNPAMFELLLLLFDRSEFLAERAIRTPDLVDDLIVGERLGLRKDVAGILNDLRHGRTDADQMLWLRRYHEAEQMRLGLRDILGLAPYEQNMFELSHLADACLAYALEVVQQEQRLKRPPFAIIGLGKLGGCEINYGSDLDVLFVADTTVRNLPKLQNLAARVLELLSRRTEQGIVFVTDARLRPDGAKGLLVNTLTAYEDYYRQRAQLWEIQALVRSRPVAGDAATGTKFQALAESLSNFKALGATREPGAESKPKAPAVLPPVCFAADWKARVLEMRTRVAQERTPRGQDELAIKTGRGGLMDAEFVAQALCLEHGWHEGHTMRALERGRNAGLLPLADSFLESYQQLRRVEGILRRWSYEGETVLPDDPAPYYRVAVRCGFLAPDDFRAAVAGWREAIRAGYEAYFAEKEKPAAQPVAVKRKAARKRAR